MSDITSKELIKSLQKGIQFLVDKQMHSGEFATLNWKQNNVESASYVKSVFFTSFILHSLKYSKKSITVKIISQNALNFLSNEMEINGFWRYSGKGSFIHFDMDTTSSVLSSVKEWGIELDYQTLASSLLKYRNKQGLFYTWILDTEQPFTKKDNNIDWVVNANILFFYSLMNIPLPKVEKYLIHIVKSGKFKKRSPYYDSPFTFIYCLTRVYSDGNNSRIISIIPKIRDYLRNIINENKSFYSQLENALVAVSLLNCGYTNIELRLTLKYLLNLQRKDGGWSMGSFHTGGPYLGYDTFYGSDALTTAIALEAISKYLKKNLND